LSEGFCFYFYAFLRSTLYLTVYTYRAFELFLLGVRETMVLIVAFLVKPFAAILADEWLHALVNPHVGVKRRRAVKGLATRATNVRLLRSVDDLVATQRRCLPETFITYLYRRRPEFINNNNNIYIHICQSYVHTPRYIQRTSHLYRTNRPARGPRRFVRFWASGGAKFLQNVRFLAFDADETPCKFDADSFIHGGVSRNRTNTHTKTNTQTNNRYIHTSPIGMCR